MCTVITRRQTRPWKVPWYSASSLGWLDCLNTPWLHNLPLPLTRNLERQSIFRSTSSLSVRASKNYNYVTKLTCSVIRLILRTSEIHHEILLHIIACSTYVDLLRFFIRVCFLGRRARPKISWIFVFILWNCRKLKYGNRQIVDCRMVVFIYILIHIAHTDKFILLIIKKISLFRHLHKYTCLEFIAFFHQNYLTSCVTRSCNRNSIRGDLPELQHKLLVNDT